MISKRTQLRFLVDGTPSGNGWSAKTIPNENNEKKSRVSIQIDSPSDAIIGKYTVRFLFNKKKTEISFLLVFFFKIFSYYLKFVQ